jgi:hypothetical protein
MVFTNTLNQLDTTHKKIIELEKELAKLRQTTTEKLSNFLMCHVQLIKSIGESIITIHVIVQVFVDDSITVFVSNNQNHTSMDIAVEIIYLRLFKN